MEHLLLGLDESIQVRKVRLPPGMPALFAHDKSQVLDDLIANAKRHGKLPHEIEKIVEMRGIWKRMGRDRRTLYINVQNGFLQALLRAADAHVSTELLESVGQALLASATLYTERVDASDRAKAYSEQSAAFEQLLEQVAGDG